MINIMVKKQRNQNSDKLIVILFFLSITLNYYFVSLSQSNDQKNNTAPIYILLFPFGVALLQILRTMTIIRRCKADALCKSWVYIFIYYIFAFVIGLLAGHEVNKYNTTWFVICPPAAWWYFSMTMKVNASLKDILISLSFWILLVFSLISLYFIPQSLRDNGLFASLNAGYYLLCLYPLVLLNTSKVKKVVATILMVLIVLLSMKRGGYVVLGLAFPLYMFFSTKLSILKKIVIISATIGALFYIIPIIDDFTHGTLTRRYEFSQNGGDEEGRSEMYPKVWNAVWASDIPEQVFGHGLNAVSNNKVVDGTAAHNDYLEFLYDFGIIGLLLLMFYQWQLYLITKRSYIQNIFFMPTLFAFTTIVVLSMISILYAFYYFSVIIPYWCLINHLTKKKRISK